MERKIIYSLIISLIITLIIFSFNFSSFTGYHSKIEYVKIKKVIDGDTLVTYSGEKIRLLGINAPEHGKPFYLESKNYLKFLQNKTVKLVPCTKDKDRYGRLLRFVFLDNKLINLKLVEKGLAHTFFIGNCYRYRTELSKAQKYARLNQLGIWRKSRFSPCINITKFKYIGKNEFVSLSNICNYSINLNGWYIKDEDRHFFIFPKYELQPYQIITVYTNNKTSMFSFNSSIPIWDNSGDSLFLRDSSGFLVTFYSW